LILPAEGGLGLTAVGFAGVFVYSNPDAITDESKAAWLFNH